MYMIYDTLCYYKPPSYTITRERTLESNLSVQQLQSSMKLAELWILKILDMKIGFLSPFHNLVIIPLQQGWRGYSYVAVCVWLAELVRLE